MVLQTGEAQGLQSYGFIKLVSRYFVKLLEWGVGPPEDNTSTELGKTYIDNPSGILTCDPTV
jgi:hypothetical protein